MAAKFPIAAIQPDSTKDHKGSKQDDHVTNQNINYPKTTFQPKFSNIRFNCKIKSYVLYSTLIIIISKNGSEQKIINTV